jgi:KDO2-lipid IV(A) lauroyltransferase
LKFPEFNSIGARLRRRVKTATNAIAGSLAVLLLKTIRRIDPDRISDFAGGVLRRLGPWLPEHRTGSANLRAAFPEKSDADIEAILAGVWDSLGRVGAEFAHLDRLWDFDPQQLSDPTQLKHERVEISAEAMERFLRLRDDGKPALIFSAHLANWELPVVTAATYGLESAILYRAPNIGDIAEAIQKVRALHVGTLIPTGLDATFRVSAALERGTHVGMFVDQHFSKGVDVVFFGRPCKANPMIARLARHFDCPIHGVRVIRLPHRRFRVELTEAIAPVRGGDGDIDVPATMQRITSVVEEWIREYPEQWLWLHRRWR